MEQWKSIAQSGTHWSLKAYLLTPPKESLIIIFWLTFYGKQKKKYFSSSQVHEALRSFVEVCHAGITQLACDRNIRTMYINEMDMKDQVYHCCTCSIEQANKMEVVPVNFLGAEILELYLNS